MRATSRWLLAAALLLGASCAQPATAPLDPLFSAPAGEGALVLPAPRPATIAAPEPTAPAERCKHVFEPHSTHLTVDRLTGLPTLCAVTICRKCGELRHECSPPPRR